MKEKQIIYSILLALFPALFLYSKNIAKVSILEISSLIFAICIVIIIIKTILNFIIKDKQKSYILLNLIIIIFYAGPIIYNNYFEKIIDSFTIAVYSDKFMYLGFICTLFVIAAYFILNSKKNLNFLLVFLKHISIIMTIMILINIGIYNIKVLFFNSNFSRNNSVNKLNYLKKAPPPDIYYIVIDGYANNSTLKEFYGYDNSEFTNYLEKKGFFVALNSKSNYPTTMLSLSSSLNMEYLDSLNRFKDFDIKTTETLKLMNHSKVLNLLKSMGYKFVYFNSGWSITNIKKGVDLKINDAYSTEFIRTYLRRTMLFTFVDKMEYWDLRNNILYAFDKIPGLPNFKAPKFVYIHIICPHPPYLFDRNGNKVSYTINQDWQNKSKYLDQTIFITKKVKTLINQILLNSKNKPIIILQSDHGPASGLVTSENWSNPTDAMIKERTRILNAYYLPNNESKYLYSSITPVNTFRIIFNEYFGTNYPILKDKVYFVGNKKKQYNFKEVTNRL